MQHDKRMAKDLYASQHGCHLNKNEGLYVRWSYYNKEKKVSVGAEYNKMKREAIKNGEQRVNISELGRICNVGWDYAKKVASEIESSGRVIDPSEVYQTRDVPRGPGSIAMDQTDCFVLLFLYLEEPSRTLSQYVNLLAVLTGTLVDRSTISKWFKDAFRYRGSCAAQTKFD
ncbi:hypothetical protein HJC23_006386 [Cyclotella cryptica]|uniref:Transposase n=1 Tax=Cyclotella cryptica TaxID=29204 RepID=A0ABD3Q495_9STRA